MGFQRRIAAAASEPCNPTFATPNFFDCTADHRMALRGRKIEAHRIYFGWFAFKSLLEKQRG